MLCTRTEKFNCTNHFHLDPCHPKYKSSLFSHQTTVYSYLMDPNCLPRNIQIIIFVATHIKDQKMGCLVTKWGNPHFYFLVSWSSCPRYLNIISKQMSTVCFYIFPGRVKTTFACRDLWPSGTQFISLSLRQQELH